MPSQCDKSGSSVLFCSYKPKAYDRKNLDTYDIERSIEKFVTTYFVGCVECTEITSFKGVILYDKYDLARIIKSVIKEITFSRMCKIRFASEKNSFIIIFESHRDTPPSEDSVKHLIAEAEHLGLYITAEDTLLRIYVPTRRVPTDVYEPQDLYFYNILKAVFCE